MFIIYKTTNKINGKIYIGQHQQDTTTFDGYLGSGSILKQAIAKYGIDAFARETLAACESKEVANITEIALINQYDSRNPHIGYNIMEGGTGGDTISNHPNRDTIATNNAIRMQRRVADGSWTNPLDAPGAYEKLVDSIRYRSNNNPEHWDHIRGPRTDDQMVRRLNTFAENKASGKHQDAHVTSANISAAQKRRFAENPDTHGMLGGTHTEASRAKISQTRKDRIAAGTIKPSTPNTELISGENNYQFKGWYDTPWGRFASINAASTSPDAMITDSATIRKIFNNIDDIASTRSARRAGGVKGHTWRQLGFVFYPS